MSSSREVHESTILAVWTAPLLDLQMDEQPHHVYFDSTEGESQSIDAFHPLSDESEDGQRDREEDEPMTDADGQTPSAAGMDLTEGATSMEGVEADSSSQQVGLECFRHGRW